MSSSVIAAMIWMVVTNLRGMFPSSDNHWRFAYLMIALGVPILIWLFIDHGIWLALLFLLGAMWILRWPVIYLGRWLKKVIGK
ncbi:DUF2484 family protein [Cognatishimia sp. SS12]|uniref:DUF2484 family protein n=1 Tax=Cognatishimia sp. SS12 TaxID=2979465 RepID=UPI00232CAE3B|nr:DUF2484 family protein [Cognatishimia sp. SS12]MDC0736933.1 DUF2484 family protein [Cognatishimia sp. SS12]